MKCFSILPGLVLAALTLVAAGTPAHADKPAHAGTRPFHASGEGVVAGALYAPRCEATHLGRSSLFVDLGLDPRDYFVFLPLRAYLTAASGDRLDFDFNAEYYVVDGETGIVSATVTFTGGTGRFQDAAGSADVTFDLYQFINNYSFDFSFQIDGSIAY